MQAVAISHIDEMKYRFWERDAQVQRAKEMCRDVCRVAKEEIVRTLTDHANYGGASSVEEMISPILGALDRISTVKTEEAYRREERMRQGLPELKVYPREICRRVASSAITSCRNVRRGK